MTIDEAVASPAVMGNQKFGGSSITCRFCGTALRHTLVDLGMSPLCESLLKADQLNQREPFFPLHMLVCEKRFLVQLQPTSAPPKSSPSMYIFPPIPYSGGWLKHASDHTDTITQRLGLNQSSHVVEVASNDGYLLQYFVRTGNITPPATIWISCGAESLADSWEKYLSVLSLLENNRSRGLYSPTRNGCMLRCERSKRDVILHLANSDIAGSVPNTGMPTGPRCQRTLFISLFRLKEGGCYPPDDSFSWLEAFRPAGLVGRSIAVLCRRGSQWRKRATSFRARGTGWPISSHKKCHSISPPLFAFG